MTRRKSAASRLVLVAALAAALIGCKTNSQLSAEQRIGTVAELGGALACSGVQTECQETRGSFVFNYRLDPISGGRYQLSGLVSQIGNRYSIVPRFEVNFFVIKDNTIVDVIVARTTGTISTGLKLSEQLSLTQRPDAVRVANYSAAVAQ